MTAPTPAGEGGETPHELAQRVIDTWGDGNPPIVILARALLSSPRVEEVRREALEEAAKACSSVGADWAEDGQMLKRYAADYLAAHIRSLSPTDKQACG